jgi:hypothetical protein
VQVKSARDHHEPGTVHQIEQGDVVGIAKLYETGRLQGRITIDGPTKVLRVVCKNSNRGTLGRKGCVVWCGAVRSSCMHEIG